MAAQKMALLVGVSTYAEKPLDGPEEDLAAVQTTLVTGWGFQAGEIKVLKNQQATKNAILEAIDQLGQRAQAGDTVFIYFSGHGTSALDSGNQVRLALPQSSGALVPWDAVKTPTTQSPSFFVADRLIVGRTDLRPRLEILDRKGAHVWVVADACYSGQSVRSVPGMQRATARLPRRFLPNISSDSRLLPDMSQASSSAPSTDPYPYQNVVYLSAAAQGEVASDINKSSLELVPTVDGKAHGALTDALLRALNNRIAIDLDGDGRVTYRELYGAIAGNLADRGFDHSPQLLPPVAEDQHLLGTRTVLNVDKPFGGRALSSKGQGARPLRIAMSVTPKLDNDRSRQLPSLLQNFPGVELVSKIDNANLVIGLESQSEFSVRTVSADVLAGFTYSDLPKFRNLLASYAVGNRLQQEASAGQRGLLAFDINPSAFGGNFLFGQKLNFVVRPDKQSYLVVLDLDANGRWTTLYPSTAAETSPLAALQPRFIPGEQASQMIEVRAPAGMDTVYAFAFDEPPQTLKEITGLDSVDLQDGRVERFIAELRRQSGRYTFAQRQLRTLAGSSKPTLQ